MGQSLVENEKRPQSADGATVSLSLAELQRIVRSTDPAALMILPRIVRRVIRQHRQLTGLGIDIPHRKSYVIKREDLLAIVEIAELGLEADEPLPEKLILLAQPSAEKLANMSADEALVHCWRLLFHSRVHWALEQRVAEGALSEADLRRRIHRIGSIEWDEIRSVLQQEGYLLPPRDEPTTYVEFVAVYLELSLFAKSCLPRFFPALDFGLIDELIGEDLDPSVLFLATRPARAPDPVDPSGLNEWEDSSREGESQSTVPALGRRIADEQQYRRWMAKAQRAASLGNLVRSAIFKARARRVAPLELVGRCRISIRMDVDRLIRRLQAALDLEERGSPPWHESLLALVDQAPAGFWTAEARLLYDLQKVCVDHERGVYTVALLPWLFSLGKRPLRRPLPSQRDVLMSKHLRSASRRLAAIRLTGQKRQQLSVLIRTAMARSEDRLRERFRPVIHDVLLRVGLRPGNLPEEVALSKLVEELLDQIVERGFLTMGHLRDAISRNNLKLPDISQLAELVRGDPLLRADRRLASRLEGVYSGGEFYLRWMQRVSSLGFGTSVGRFLTRYVAVPFGGAYVILKGVQHLVETAASGEIHAAPALESQSAELAQAAASGGMQWATPWSVFALGLFLLGLLYVGAFRRGVWSLLRTSYRALRWTFVDLPLLAVRLPMVRRILESRLARLAWRFVLKPLALSALVWAAIPGKASNWEVSAGSATGLFVGMNLLLNSRIGRNAEEVLTDWIVHNWHRFGLQVITGLFWLVVDVFRGLLEAVERLLYTVDEWLQFKSGDRGLWLGIKAVLKSFWFCVNYVIRFCVTLLIEPQINPIKHFPVVTVSHKLLWPLAPYLASVLQVAALAALHHEMGKEAAFAWAGLIITAIPGVFGFLVWELKENWRLYAANRRDGLGPAIIGHHGETMNRLLRPGFHSGTIPKRYAKLRRAERRARSLGNWTTARKHVQALRHIEVAIRRYAQRELTALLAGSRGWGGIPISVEEVHVATNRVGLALSRPDSSGDPLEIAFEVQSGWLVATFCRPGWSEHLTHPQRSVLRAALIGLCKTGGVDLVRQQIEAIFPPPGNAYDFTECGLMVRTLQLGDGQYDLRADSRWITPEPLDGSPCFALPPIERSRLLFREIPVRWSHWVEVWQQDQDGQPVGAEALAPVRVLPA